MMERASSSRPCRSSVNGLHGGIYKFLGILGVTAVGLVGGDLLQDIKALQHFTCSLFV
jgi:hypothetical protein